MYVLFLILDCKFLKISIPDLLLYSSENLSKSIVYNKVSNQHLLNMPELKAFKDLSEQMATHGILKI